nr:MAG TPA: hypothetical protein [Caudoviricetes sp.]
MTNSAQRLRNIRKTLRRRRFQKTRRCSIDIV